MVDPIIGRDHNHFMRNGHAQAAGLALLLRGAVLLRLVPALACIVVLVVVAAFLVGGSAVPATAWPAARIGVSLFVLPALITRHAGLIRIASIACAAHDFFSCLRFCAPLPSLPY
jgi:hypothetical protein